MLSEEPSEETLNEWHSDPSNWKLGIFYYNKKDKRIFPPKRLPALGWTTNFANPVSFFTLFGIVVLVIILIRFSK